MEGCTRCNECTSYCELCALYVVKRQQATKCQSCDCVQTDVAGGRMNDPWLCRTCVYKLLPFGNNDDSTEFLDCTEGIVFEDLCSKYNATSLNLNFYSDNEENNHLLNNEDIDPDEHFFVNNQPNLSRYNTPERLKAELGSIEHDFTLMHVNSRSLTPKLEEIDSLLIQLPVKILAITETWLDQSTTPPPALPDYSFVHKPRNKGRGGGVALFIRKEFQFHILEPPSTCLTHTTYESLFICIPQDKGTDLIVGVIYRPPGTNLTLFNDEFNVLLADITNSKKEIILAGDFNIDLLKADKHEQTKMFYNYMTSYQILPTISKPTRITDLTSSLIDNIFTNQWNKVNASSIIVTDISDHLPIMVRLNLNMPKCNKMETKNQRKTGKLEMEYFQLLLSEINWTEITTACANEDANMAYNNFITNYKNAYNKAFPLYSPTKSKKRQNNQPWMTSGLLNSCKKKNKLYLKFIKQPNETNKKNFIIYRNKFKTTKKKAELLYYEIEFQKYSNNLKKQWQIIRSILRTDNKASRIDLVDSNGVMIEDDETIANKFNSYFTSIPQNLAEKIPSSPNSYNKYMKSPCDNSLALYLTNPEEIINISCSIKPTHSSGLDDIDPMIALPLIKSIAQPLSEIINCSFSTGVVPDELKLAKIVPIFKQGNKEDLTNYRPISVLPVFSKILEKIMYERLNNHLIKNDILYSMQHGFRSGHSTAMSLINLQEQITTAIDNNEFSVGIFIDLAKAFDTVDHGILLKKLQHYGIRGVTHQWFSSYLTNRNQQVICNGILSKFQQVKYGVPQGSNLGPLLFLIYINDLPNTSTILNFIIFADDTNVFHSHKSLDELYQIINHEITYVVDWFRINKLSLNINKTNFILFRSHRKLIPEISIQLLIDGNIIPQVSTTKFLGIHIDQHLNWSEHIKIISMKIAKNTGILNRLASYVPQQVLLNLYYSLIYPYLAYGNIVWASNYMHRLHKINILQKRAVRIIARVLPSTHTSQFFSRFKILRLNQINTIQISEFMYRHKHKLLPSVFNDYFNVTSDTHTYLTRQVESYRGIYARTNTRLFALRSTGPSVWNNIPVSTRHLPNLNLF